MTTVLVTGAAGFIGFHVSQTLLSQGHSVIGVDNLNEYYDVQLKQARLRQLLDHPNFDFHCLDLAERDRTATLFQNPPLSESFTWQDNPVSATR